MNMKRLTIILLFALPTLAFAGKFNLISCLSEEEAVISVTVGGRSDELKLAPGQQTGSLATAEEPVEISASAQGHSKKSGTPSGLIFLYPIEDGIAFESVDSEPSPGELTVRFINLSPEPVTFQFGKTEITSEPGKLTRAAFDSRPPLKVKFPDQPNAPAFELEDSAAVVCAIIKVGDVWRTFWVVDL